MPSAIRSPVRAGFVAAVTTSTSMRSAVKQRRSLPNARRAGTAAASCSSNAGSANTICSCSSATTLMASRDRLALANQAGSLGLALDAADTIQAQDSLEKMLVHQMAVLHYGMMRATARMNEELDAAGVIDPKRAAGVIDLNKREAAEAAN